MEVKLVSHVNGDGDLLPAWFQYYQALGVSSFHIILHGPPSENMVLLSLRADFPVVFADDYDGVFALEEKKKRVQNCLRDLRHNWILLVDSDEFVELPHCTLEATIAKMQACRANTLFAPMVQRLTADGSLDTPVTIERPFDHFPLCSVDLYAELGVKASTSKYPLFYCDDETFVYEGGNHISPNGLRTILPEFRGVTHHFKWKRSVLDRLEKRAGSDHTYRQESIGYLAFLKQNDYRLPTANAFPYSREELFRRGLLVREQRCGGGTFSAEFDFFWKAERKRNQQWLRHIEEFNRALKTCIPPLTSFIFVDENQLDKDLLGNFGFIPFLERNGIWWGAPETDEVAIEQVREKVELGVRYVVFAWTAFWWLEHYRLLKDYLLKNASVILSNDSLVLFDFGSNEEYTRGLRRRLL